MPRYKLIVEYDGAGLAGWQRQNDVPSVQQHLEEAIEKFAQERVTVFGAGRTDAGVHALGQVCHFDLSKEADSDTMREAVNFHLKPAAITVIEAAVAAPDFHARFSAKQRSYIYRILNRRARPALAAGRVWHVMEVLDITRMREGAKHLLGQHDFTSFRDAQCQAKSPIRSINHIQIEQEGEEIHVVVVAPSFLHHMVRTIVGTLRLVGNGKIAPEDVKRMLEAKDRTQAGPNAPAEGLYFLNVLY